MNTAPPSVELPPDLLAERTSARIWWAEDWRDRPIGQQPRWPDPEALRATRNRLASLPPLTAFADARRLEASLARVSAGQAFLLQAGDCAEPLGRAAVASVRGKHGLLGSMAETISERADIPTVTVGRLAGQFAKPRSQPTEVVDGRELEVFRGEMVNSRLADPRLRIPDPDRLLQAYQTSRAVLNELHALAHETADPLRPGAHPDGGTAPVTDGRLWDGSLRSVLDGYGRTVRGGDGRWSRTGLWTSHESLLLDYEEPLVRRDPRTGEWFLLSTHLPWIGQRTNRVDGAHVAFHSRISNPVGCKIGPSCTAEEIVRLCRTLDPNRRPGRLVLIFRMGADHVRDRLPELVRAVRGAGHHPVWMCDPMHGNTEKTRGGRKTRRTDRILAETTAFFEVLGRAGEWPGGLHLEVTEGQVTECLGPGGAEYEEQLGERYLTLCDPRLNEGQALALAGAVSRLVAAG